MAKCAGLLALLAVASTSWLASAQTADLVEVTMAVDSETTVTDSEPTKETAPPPSETCKYMIVMPSTVWLGSTLEVKANVETPDEATRCYLTVQANTQEKWRRWSPWARSFTSGSASNVSVQQTFMFNGKGDFTLQMPTQGRVGRNTLLVRVKGQCASEQGMCVIDNSTHLHVEKSRSTLLIELDKPIYKPSQRVQGRVVAVDSSLLPVEGIIPLIFITDAKSSRVAQWRNVTLRGGLASFSLPISSEPVLGEWKVVVQGFESVDDVEEKFTVDEYVLPKFDVGVEMTPKCLSLESDEICVEIDAKYTHGRPVKGDYEMKLDLKPQYVSYFKRFHLSDKLFTAFGFEHTLRKPSERWQYWRERYVRVEPAGYVFRGRIGDSEEVSRVCLNFRDMDIKLTHVTSRGEVLRIRPGYDPVRQTKVAFLRSDMLYRGFFAASVNVTETATGEVRNASVELKCQHRQPYEIKFAEQKYSGKFQPGLPLSGTVIASRRDEEPLNPNVYALKMTCRVERTGQANQNILNSTLSINAAGRASFTIEQVPCASKAIYCQAVLLKNNASLRVQRSKYYNALYSPTSTFLANSMVGPRFQLKSTARVPLCLFTCHEQEVYSLSYTVNARGHMVHTGTLDVQRASLSATSECVEEPATEATTTEAPSTEAPTTEALTVEAATVPLEEGSGNYSISTETLPPPVPIRKDYRYPWVVPYPPLIPLPTEPPRPCPCECRKSCDMAIEFPVSAKMGPKGKLTVYMTLSTGEMVVDTLDFTVSSVFENEVKIKFDSDTYRPGQDAKLHLSAAPGSTVAYSAVDKSLHILGGNNQITPARATSSMDLKNAYGVSLGDFRNCRNPYGGGRGYSPDIGFAIDNRRRRKRSSLPYYYYQYSSSYVDALDSWADSNMAIITSYNLATKPCPVYRPRVLYEVFDSVAGPRGLPGPVPEVARNIAPPAATNGGLPQADTDKSAGPPVKIASKRSFFPETWLFKTLELRDSQHAQNITVKVPDTITSWSAAAYAVSKELGLGVADPTEITVFQPFFLSMKLPYSVIRCEILELPISVFNYVPGCMQVTVELIDTPCYKNVGGSSIQELCLCTNDVDTVRFNVSFNSLGDCPITVVARTGGTRPCMRPGETVANAVAVDRVRRVMKVEPAGVEMEHVESSYEVKKAHDKPYSVMFPISSPEDIVSGSGRAWLSIVGDLLGPSLEGLENLLRLPYGCGEQNMLNFAPGISIAKYLMETGQLDQMPAVKEKATNVILQGYQRENRYRHSNGAFSAFGERSWFSHRGSGGGCLWLTSFVVKSFCKAKSTGLVAVDDEQICESLQWIASKQQRDGSFLDNGCLHNKRMMGGAQTTYSHTAYICLGLMELADLGCNCSSKQLTHAIAQCKSYLNGSFTAASTSHAAAITCYGMSIGGSPEASRICQTLENKKQDGDHWEQQHVEKPSCSNRWSCYRRQPSANVEITAYGLLASLRRTQDLPSQILIAKWMAAQRNSYGGFSSTQDTVIALDALAQLASRLYYDNANTRALKVTYRYKPDNAATFNMESHSIDANNRMVVFRRELRPIPGKLHIRIRGAGSALLQVATRYNVREEVPDAAFRLSYSIFHVKPTEHVIQICTSWQRDGNASNMALVTLKLPSGYTAMPAELNALKGDAALQLERWDIDGRQVFFYFEEIDTAGKCFNVTMTQEIVVDKMQPMFIRVQDYYEPAHEATTEYSLDSVRKCATNFTFDSCHAPCTPHTCDAFLQGTPVDTRLCDSGCRCKDNYKRLGARCVLASDCKRLVNACGQDEVHSDCGAACQDTCATHLSFFPRICPFICQRGCVCRPGYVRLEEGGECVPTDQCTKADGKGNE